MKTLMLCYVLFILLTPFLILSSTGDTDLAVGNWRGEFKTDNKSIPFNFIVERSGTSSSRVYLRNAAERALLDNVYHKGDSVIIDIGIYDAILIGKIQGDSLKGFFRKNQIARKGVPFFATHNQDFRFKVTDKRNAASVKGKWSLNLISERDGKSSASYTVGVFDQQGNKVTGTILTTTGDYRYLEGVVDGKHLKLSSFSGSNASLIEAELTGSDELKGTLYYPGVKIKIEGIRNDTARLPDPYALTYLKQGYDRLSFSFPDLDGNPVSLSDDKYKGKVVVLTVLGSWCPNCVDEAAFLAPWYKENKRRGVEIVGLSFERKDDLAFAKSRLATLIDRFDIRYDILFAGVADKKVVAEKLPELNTFLSFPTTFFIDKQGKVRKVHTGYNGPATGRYYQEFIAEFNREVDILLKEPS